MKIQKEISSYVLNYLKLQQYKNTDKILKYMGIWQIQTDVITNFDYKINEEQKCP